MQGPSLGWEDALEKGMTTHSSFLAWRSPWTEEPGGLQLIRLQKVDTTEATQHSTQRTHTHAHTCSFAVYLKLTQHCKSTIL